MSRHNMGEINFWPAYVDALINVVLNLLFLVGVFTIGLVTLNAEALMAEKAAATRKIASILASPSATERQRLATELFKTLAAKPVVRPAIDQTTPHEVLRIKEIYLRADADLQGKSDAADVTAAASTSAQTPQQSIAALIQGTATAQVEFDINQHTLPAQWRLPPELDISPQKKWSLYVISDPANPRLSREAFARLVVVRSALIQAGARADQVQLQVLASPQPNPSPPALSTPALERTVLIVERSM